MKLSRNVFFFFFFRFKHSKFNLLKKKKKKLTMPYKTFLSTNSMYNIFFFSLFYKFVVLTFYVVFHLTYAL